MIAVSFTGDGCGEAPLTWAQADHWQGVLDAGVAATFGGSFEMPEQFTVDSAVAMVQFMLSRHQGLRTRLRFGADGWPRQVCSSSGVFELIVVEADGPPAQLAADLAEEFRTRPFDYADDWPVRFGLVPDGDHLHLVVVYLHLALDGGGAAALQAELDYRRPEVGIASEPVTAITPLMQAHSQSRPSAQRQSAAALRHFSKVLRAAPTRQFGPPTGDGSPVYEAIRYRSPVMGPALDQIAGEHVVSLAAAQLAVFAVALARQLRQSTVWALVLVSNRFRPGVAGSVSLQAQTSPFLLDVDGISLRTAVGRAGAGLLATYKSAYYDGRQRDRVLVEAAAEHGEPIELGCIYNDRLAERAPVGVPPDLRDLVGAGSWVAESARAVASYPLAFNVDFLDGATQFSISWDVRYLERADILALLAQLETVAVAMVLSPDQPARLPVPLPV